MGNKDNRILLEVLVRIAIIVVVGLVSYFMIGYITMNFNPETWSIDARFFHTSFIGGGIFMACYPNRFIEKDKGVK